MEKSTQPRACPLIRTCENLAMERLEEYGSMYDAAFSDKHCYEGHNLCSYYQTQYGLEVKQ